MDMDLQAAFNKAVGLHQLGRLSEAQAIYDRILQAAPAHPETVQLRGAIDLQQGRYTEALARFDHALALKPGYGTAHANRASALLALARYGDALVSCEIALQANPASANIWSNRAAILNKLGRYAKALTAAHQALSLNPRHLAAHGARVQALRGLGGSAEALAACDQSLAVAPQADIHGERGAILVDLQRYAEALEACDRALALDPGLASAHVSRANALTRLQRFDDAIAAYDTALNLAPALADAHCNRAIACNEMWRWGEALASCTKALALRADYPEALVAQALAYRGLERHWDAVVACTDALAIAPGLPDAMLIRGLSLEALARYEDALVDLEALAAAKPETPLIHGIGLLCSLQICRWDGIAARIKACLADIDAGGNGVGPFAAAALPVSPRQQQAAAARFFADTAAAPDGYQWTKGPAAKVHVGYFSADFFDHATSRLAAGLFECHDRARFEVTAFAFGNGVPGDPMRKRLERGFARLIDVTAMTPQATVARARELGIDIAIDLKGFTKNSRPSIFGLGAAPVQVNYLGYPGTLGSSRYDYVIGDRFVTPADYAPYFSESIVTLPGSYQVNDSRRPVPAGTISRRDLGLPEQAFVFCSFNNTFKITPEVFEIWMRLLAAIPGSVLWQLEDNPASARNLRREAHARGVDPARLVFAPRVGAAEHLARHRAADLFLDTFPCNAHTTASDALWAGLPVLTCMTAAFPGRVAAGLLAAVGLAELITHSPADYEALALTLARAPATLAGYRRRLDDGRMTCALFDTARFTRNLETAYLQMWARYQAGLAPAPITVAEGSQPG
jgi:predicted O-linked N-acetylglucosamine transferase (SPINDLY family)